MRFFIVGLATLAWLSCSATTTHTITRSEMPTTIQNVEQARAALGQRVRVVGQTQRTKLAPSVSTGALHVYCLGLSGWPDEATGQRVAVTGRIEESDDFEATGSVADGTISQGTSGPVWVLRDCQFEGRITE